VAGLFPAVSIGEEKKADDEADFTFQCTPFCVIQKPGL
jgi:hypothetical protein